MARASAHGRARVSRLVGDVRPRTAIGGGNNSQAPGELALAATFTRHSDSSIFWRAV
jgi:hypothetical protein